MKKLILIVAFILPLLYTGCKEDDPEATIVKIEASGSAYSITVKDNDAVTLLSKEGQNGANTYSLSVSKDIGVYYTTQSTLTLKVFKNNTIVHDAVINPGNGVYAVHIE